MSGAIEKLDFLPSLKQTVYKKESGCVYVLCFVLGERWVDQTFVVSSKCNQCFDHCCSSCAFCTKIFRNPGLFSSLGFNVEEGSYSGRPFFNTSLYHPLF
jgi:hypothetical protein